MCKLVDLFVITLLNLITGLMELLDKLGCITVVPLFK